MASSNLIRYNNISIVYTDISDASPEESMGAFKRSCEIIEKMPLKSVYSLVNAKEARFNSALIQTVKDTVKKNNPYNKATAVSGLSPLSRLMVNSIVAFTGRQMKLTETVEEAKEWLYSISQKDEVKV